LGERATPVTNGIDSGRKSASSLLLFRFGDSRSKRDDFCAKSWLGASAVVQRYEILL